jgi:mono/diheme cytochrome c family protein
MKIFMLGALLLPLALMAQTKKIVKSAPAKATTSSNSQTSIQRGQVIYKTHCLTCHQANGGGVGTLNPPFVQPWAGGEKSRIIRMILKGSVGKVEIDGDNFSNTMPAQPALTDQQIADVLTYVRNNFGIKASAVTAAEVKAVRAKTK